MSPKDVLEFWLSLSDEDYFQQSESLDALIRQTFRDAHEAAKKGAYDAWQATPEGTVALVILLDQFSRNIYRQSAAAFAGDEKSLEIAKAAVARGDDMRSSPDMRKWLYLPFMHSENLDDQQTCIRLCERSGFESTQKWARIHSDVIERFGRFPHRNDVLGRKSTLEELRFLDQGGFSG